MAASRPTGITSLPVVGDPRVSIQIDANQLRSSVGPAWGHLYTTFSGYIYRYHLRRCGNHQDASDLTNETFVRAMAVRSSIRPEEFVPRAWLTGIARVVCAEHLRRARKRDALLLAMYRQPASETSPSDPAAILVAEVQRKQCLDNLLRAWSTIGQDDREVLRLVCLEGHNSNEVSKILEIQPAAVRKRLQRALVRLRCQVLEEEPSEGTSHLGDQYLSAQWQ